VAARLVHPRPQGRAGPTLTSLPTTIGGATPVDAETGETARDKVINDAGRKPDSREGASSQNSRAAGDRIPVSHSCGRSACDDDPVHKGGQHRALRHSDRRSAVLTQNCVAAVADWFWPARAARWQVGV